MNTAKPEKNENDSNLELALRPSNWSDYVGQEKIKKNLRLIIEAARQRNESCDHLLFYGQAGLGKTTLAYLVGKEMQVPVKSTSGPALEKAGDVAAILSNLEPHEILFIDEAHRINKLIEEILYPALEARKLHLVVGKGPSARTISLDLPPFTVIAATTKADFISGPLRSRFGATFRLEYYNLEDIQKIIERSAGILGVKITKEAVKILAEASRFTPRTANRLLKRARDYAQVYPVRNSPPKPFGRASAGVISNGVHPDTNKEKLPFIDDKTIQNILEMLEIDELGLELADRQLLEIIIKRFNGGPVGLKAMSAALNEEMGAIEDIYEPFLMRLGLLHRTPTGRIATPAAYEHLKIPRKSTLL